MPQGPLWRSYAGELPSISNSLREPADLSCAAADGDRQKRMEIRVMFTTAIGLRGQANPNGWAHTKAMRSAALLGALILVSVAVNALIVIADGNLRERPSTVEIAR